MSLGVSDIARGSVEPLLSVFRLSPLLRHQLRSKKLGRGLLDPVTVVYHEHVVGPPTVGAGGMWWGVGEVVVVVRGFAACAEKSAERISQPQSAEDVDGGLATMIVGFRIQERDSSGQAIVAPYFSPCEWRSDSGSCGRFSRISHHRVDGVRTTQTWS